MELRLAAPPDNELQDLLRQQRDLDLSYPEVGATTGELPSGYRATRESTSLGRDPSLVERVGHGLLAWELHRAAGLRVAAGGPTASDGLDVVLAVPLWGLHVVAACRVVWVTRAESRIGFAYGTLPMHPESGEESFVVERVDDDVRFTVTAFSRPTSRIRTWGRPIQDRVQDRFTRAYLRAAVELAGR